MFDISMLILGPNKQFHDYFPISTASLALLNSCHRGTDERIPNFQIETMKGYFEVQSYNYCT